MSEPDRSYAIASEYGQASTDRSARAQHLDSAQQLMSLLSRQGQAAEMCGGVSMDGFGSPALATGAARAGLGPAYTSAMGQHAQSAELRAAGVGAAGAPVAGPVGPDEATAPRIGAPLIYRSDGTGVEVELLVGDAPPSGWTVVEPSARTWALYYALYRARTDPGEVDYAALGPVVGEVFGPTLLAGLPAMGPWGKPAGQPGGMYVGTAAHKVICARSSGAPTPASTR